MTNVLVKNTTVSDHWIQLGEWDDNVRLIPGVNEVDAAAWARAEKHPVVKLRLELGEYENVPIAPPGLKDKEAIKLIAETTSDPLLERWASEEKRAKVAKAIKAQRKLLELPTQTGKESG